MTIVSVVNQLTQRIIRGNTPNTADQLLYAPLTVVRIGLAADTSDYTTIDYIVSGSSIDWSPSGQEPNPGQAYYVTYTYNPTQYIKDFATVAAELKADFNTLLPSMDVDKSAARDLYVNVPARQYTDEYNVARHILLIQSLQNVSEMTNAELDAIGVNYSKPRLPATTASGFITFFVNAPRGGNISIPAGTRVATQPSMTNNVQITFVTTQDATLITPNLSVVVPIEAEAAGLSGNVSSGTILISIDSVTVDGITNGVATTGGSDQELNEAYAARLINAFKARNIATVTGIKEYVKTVPNVIDAYVADVGDPIMTRDNNIGGKVDVYVHAESGCEGTIVEEYTVVSGVDTHTFLVQPCISIKEVYNESTTTILTPTSQYTLTKDTGSMEDSTRSSDYLTILSGTSAGNLVRVTYVTNKLFNDIQTLLDSDATGVAGIDRLVRGAVETYIDISGSIKIATGYVFNDVRTNIVNQLTDYVEAKGLGSSIVYGDVINIIHDTPGVIDLLPLSKLSRSTEFTNSTINLNGNEYPRAGTITISLMP